MSQEGLRDLQVCRKVVLVASEHGSFEFLNLLQNKQ